MTNYLPIISNMPKVLVGGVVTLFFAAACTGGSSNVEPTVSPRLQEIRQQVVEYMQEKNISYYGARIYCPPCDQFKLDIGAENFHQLEGLVAAGDADTTGADLITYETFQLSGIGDAEYVSLDGSLFTYTGRDNVFFCVGNYRRLGTSGATEDVPAEDIKECERYVVNAFPSFIRPARDGSVIASVSGYDYRTGDTPEERLEDFAERIGLRLD